MYNYHIKLQELWLSRAYLLESLVSYYLLLWLIHVHYRRISVGPSWGLSSFWILCMDTLDILLMNRLCFSYHTVLFDFRGFIFSRTYYGSNWKQTSENSRFGGLLIQLSNSGFLRAWEYPRIVREKVEALYQNNIDIWWLLSIYIWINAFLFLFEQVLYYPFWLWGSAYQNSGDPTRICEVLQYVMRGCVNKQWQEFTRPAGLLPAVSWRHFLKEKINFKVWINLNLNP